MFESKRKILSVGRNFLQGFSVRGRLVEESVSLSWSSERLKAALATMYSALGRTVRLLVGESFTYVVTVAIPSGRTFDSLADERAEVGRLAGERIPEDMREIQWDYREVSWESRGDAHRFVQVIAFTASFGNAVSPLLLESGFRVVAAEPESCAIARLVSDRKEPIILIFRGETVCIAGVMRGVVLSSVTSIASASNESVERVVAFLSEHFSLVPRSIVMAKNLSQKDLSGFDRSRAESDGYTLEEADLLAPVGIALKEDISGDDRSTLSVNVAPVKPRASLYENSRPELQDESERFHLHALDERAFAESEQESPAGFFSAPGRIGRIVLVCAIVSVALLIAIGSFIVLRR